MGHIAARVSKGTKVSLELARVKSSVDSRVVSTEQLRSREKIL